MPQHSRLYLLAALALGVAALPLQAAPEAASAPASVAASAPASAVTPSTQ